MSAIAAAVLLCGLMLMLWAQNEFGPPESIIAAQSTMLAEDGTLYYDLNRYPYTVCAYMPVFYGLEAGLMHLGLAPVAVGRMISFTALLGIVALGWRILMLYTGDRTCAWTGVLLCTCTSLLLNWGTTGQVDTLALCFSIAAFYQYSRYTILGESRLVWAAVLLILAFFTKQTMLACPATVVLLLFLRDRRTAARFAVATGTTVLVLVLGINAASDGRFLANTFFANLNPFALGKINQHVQYLMIGAGQLILITCAGAARVWPGRGKDLLVYLGLAASVLALTAPKIGSDTNYQMETTVVLILCTSLALHSLEFFPHCFRGSKTWITLLQLPLAVHTILNVRITRNMLSDRIVREQQFRQQVAALRPYLAGGGRVLSTESNALLRVGVRMEVEPLIYGILVRAGRVDPEPLRRDIAAHAFSTIILFEDLTQPREANPEIASLLPAQRLAIQNNYHPVRHIPGPYLNGIYVYKPREERRP
ncbi:MAG: DUF2029 domain-containing protein [Acidobacteriota bacterium]|nr:DUF2029 domain-containing protein [Acidobacteriota bacterium]